MSQGELALSGLAETALAAAAAGFLALFVLSWISAAKTNLRLAKYIQIAIILSCGLVFFVVKYADFVPGYPLGGTTTLFLLSFWMTNFIWKTSKP